MVRSQVRSTLNIQQPLLVEARDEAGAVVVSGSLLIDEQVELVHQIQLTTEQLLHAVAIHRFQFMV
jgi:hypothetical protein